MTDWRPTSRLRWVVRDHPSHAIGQTENGDHVYPMPWDRQRVLQQEWIRETENPLLPGEYGRGILSEWRDVPEEEE